VNAGEGSLGLIAGGGALPRRLAEAARAEGRKVFVVGLLGFAETALVEEFGGVELAIGQIGKQLDVLKGAGCEEVVIAGVVKRPDLDKLKFDMRGTLLLPKLITAAGKGDDALLRVVVEVFEGEGFRVIGADDVLGSLLATAGVIAGRAPNESERADIARAGKVAAEIGRLDIGQGAVVARGLVLAVEAQEGTDLMLQRVAQLPVELRGTPQARCGVLVKRPKPQQERRIDLPTIGVETVRRIAEAGLAGIAVEAGAALVMEREALAAEAARAGVFVYGATAAELA
jgi:DUF1009 family protein